MKPRPIPKFAPCTFCAGAGVKHKHPRFGWFYKCNLCGKSFKTDNVRTINRKNKTKLKEEKRNHLNEIKLFWAKESENNRLRLLYKQKHPV